jgi:hypothetical protein
VQQLGDSAAVENVLPRERPALCAGAEPLTGKEAIEEPCGLLTAN